MLIDAEWSTMQSGDQDVDTLANWIANRTAGISHLTLHMAVCWEPCDSLGWMQQISPHSGILEVFQKSGGPSRHGAPTTFLLCQLPRLADLCASSRMQLDVTLLIEASYQPFPLPRLLSDKLWRHVSVVITRLEVKNMGCGITHQQQQALFNLPRLQDLYLTEEGSRHSHPQHGLPRLQDLYVTEEASRHSHPQHGLRDLNGVSGLSRLTQLVLEGHPLVTSLSDDLFQLTGLKELCLSDSHVGVLPDGLSRLTALTGLGLASSMDSPVTVEPQALCGPSLQQVRFSAVEFAVPVTVASPSLVCLGFIDCDPAYGEFLQLGEQAALKALKLGGASWALHGDSLPMMQQLTALEELNLQRNQLQDLPPDFTSMAGLTGLDLAYNFFPCIPEAVTALTGLQWLRFECELPLSSWNGLIGFSSSLTRLYGLRQLRELRIGGLQTLNRRTGVLEPELSPEAAAAKTALEAAVPGCHMNTLPER